MTGIKYMVNNGLCPGFSKRLPEKTNKQSNHL